MVSSGSDRDGRGRAVCARGRQSLRAGRHNGGGDGDRHAGDRGAGRGRRDHADQPRHRRQDHRDHAGERQVLHRKRAGRRPLHHRGPRDRLRERPARQRDALPRPALCLQLHAPAAGRGAAGNRGQRRNRRPGHEHREDRRGAVDQRQRHQPPPRAGRQLHEPGGDHAPGRVDRRRCLGRRAEQPVQQHPDRRRRQQRPLRARRHRRPRRPGGLQGHFLRRGEGIPGAHRPVRRAAGQLRRRPRQRRHEVGSQRLSRVGVRAPAEPGPGGHRRQRPEGGGLQGPAVRRHPERRHPQGQAPLLRRGRHPGADHAVRRHHARGVRRRAGRRRADDQPSQRPRGRSVGRGRQRRRLPDRKSEPDLLREAHLGAGRQPQRLALLQQRRGVGGRDQPTAERRLVAELQRLLHREQHQFAPAHLERALWRQVLQRVHRRLAVDPGQPAPRRDLSDDLCRLGRIGHAPGGGRRALLAGQLAGPGHLRTDRQPDHRRRRSPGHRRHPQRVLRVQQPLLPAEHRAVDLCQHRLLREQRAGPVRPRAAAHSRRPGVGLQREPVGALRAGPVQHRQPRADGWPPVGRPHLPRFADLQPDA